MQGDQMIMLTLGCITLCLTVMIVWDIATRDSFTYNEKDEEQ